MSAAQSLSGAAKQGAHQLGRDLSGQLVPRVFTGDASFGTAAGD